MRKCFWVAAVLGVSIVVAGCGGSSTPTTGGTPQGTITLAWQQGANKAVSALVNAFEKRYPKVSVKVSYCPAASCGQVIETQFESGGGPDVVWGSPGTGNPNSLGLYNKQGYLLDLSDLPFAKSVPAEAGLRSGSSLYGIPVGVFPIGLLYNVAGLRKLGLAPPTTFSQLTADCAAVSSHSGDALIDLAASGGSGSVYLATLAAEYVYTRDPGWNAQRQAGKVTFANSPLWKTVLDRFMSMKAARCFPTGAAGNAMAQAITGAVTGSTPMAVFPADAVAELDTLVSGVKWSMAPFPADTAAATRVPISFGQALGVNKHSHNLPAAEAFIKFAAEAAEQNLVANDLGVPSVSQYEHKQLTPTIAGLAADIKAGRVIDYPALAFPNPAVYTEMGTVVEDLLTGQDTVAAGLSQLDQAWTSDSSS